MIRIRCLATLAAVVSICWMLAGGLALAQSPAPSSAPAAVTAEPVPDVGVLRNQFERLPDTASGTEDVQALQSRFNALIASANRVITARTGQLNDLNARLGELGNAPAAGATEDPDITRQRQTLTRERNTVDADIRLARLLIVDAQQRGDALRHQQRDLFEARLTDRAASPLGGRFWTELGDAWAEDRARLAPLAAELREAAANALDTAHRWPILGALLLAVLAISVGDVLAERGLARLAQRLPGGRLRRSLLVIAIVSVNLLVVALAMRGLLQTLQAHLDVGPLSSKLVTLAEGSVLYIAFVTSLGRALLANARPSWRLPRMPNALALRLRHFPWLFALVGVLLWLATQVGELVELSAAAMRANQTLTALVLVGLLFSMLSRLRGPQGGGTETVDAAEPADAAPVAGEPAAERPFWLGLALGVASVMLVLILVLVALGYVAVASLAATQLAWTGLVTLTFYVLFKFADDVCLALVSARSEFGRRLSKGLGFAPQVMDQTAVVLSALIRVLLFCYMLITLMAPLGTGPNEVLQQSDRLGSGLQIGEFQLVPATLFSALGVLAAGFVALHVFQRWLRERYLPTTTMEPGMQSSLATLLNSVGMVLVVAAGLSALGIGVNRIAWIASALSVGIGFGLQAIVQNFISGLILLAERPVKVGDWVVLGTTEGDIKRINVRATEIQLGDRSTVIVPNSEFITKTVRNMTLSNAEGRVLIRLPMPLASDAQHVRTLMLDTCSAHPKVLETPAPSLTLEGVENGMLVFQAICYVAGPRLVGGVRSELLFSMLEAFRQAGLAMAAPATVVVAAPPAAPP